MPKSGTQTAIPGPSAVSPRVIPCIWPGCHAKFSSNYDLVEHILDGQHWKDLAEQGLTREWEGIGKKTLTPREAKLYYRQHLLKDHRVQSIQCDTAKCKVYNGRSNIEKHMQKHHNQLVDYQTPRWTNKKKVKCPKCAQNFETDLLINHQLSDRTCAPSAVYLYYCHICPYAHWSTIELGGHILSHHGRDILNAPRVTRLLYFTRFKDVYKEPNGAPRYAYLSETNEWDKEKSKWREDCLRWNGEREVYYHAPSIPAGHSQDAAQLFTRSPKPSPPRLPTSGHGHSSGSGGSGSSKGHAGPSGSTR